MVCTMWLPGHEWSAQCDMVTNGLDNVVMWSRMVGKMWLHVHEWSAKCGNMITNGLHNVVI